MSKSKRLLIKALIFVMVVAGVGFLAYCVLLAQAIAVWEDLLLPLFLGIPITPEMEARAAYKDTQFENTLKAVYVGMAVFVTGFFALMFWRDIKFLRRH